MQLIETTPAPKPPDGKKPLNWPIAVNLGLLLMVAISSGADPAALGVAVLVLAFINGVAAFLTSMFGSLNWVLAFALSALLILLIGLGICALMLQGLHGGH